MSIIVETMASHWDLSHNEAQLVNDLAKLASKKAIESIIIVCDSAPNDLQNCVVHLAIIDTYLHCQKALLELGDDQMRDRLVLTAKEHF